MFKHPTSYMWSAGVQRELPWGFVVDATYVGRRGLYLQRERNINQLPGLARSGQPGVNIAALRPYKGYGVIRLSENAGYSKYNSLQLSVDRRYANGLKFGAAYTLGKSEDNASDKRNILWNTLRRHGLPGTVELRPEARAVGLHYIYDLPFWRKTAISVRTCWAVGRSRARRSCVSGKPFSITRA